MKYQIDENNVITGIFFNLDKEIVLERDINFGMDKYVNGQVVRASKLEVDTQKEIARQAEAELQNKFRRAVYLDVYRKYQAAVNYGEFQRAPAVDYFIRQLRNRNWAALNAIPPQLKYFAGETGLAASGLIENPQ